MARTTRLDGLTKWARRPEWSEAMQEMLDRHIATVCESYDVGPDELAGLVGEASVLNLWGCMFEDVISREFEDGNLADEYLKRRGWKESAGNRAYIKALRNARMSLYEVSGIKRDRGFFARDLLRGGEPVWVNEKRGTHGLAEWDRIGVRVVEVNGRAQIGGAVLAFSREASEVVIEFFEAMKKTTSRELAGMLSDVVEAAEAEGAVPPEVDGFGLDEFRQMVGAMSEEADDTPLGIDAALETGAHEFTNIWLDDTLGRLTGSRLPELYNSDGEPIAWIEASYPVARGSRQADVAAALSVLPSLRQENAKFWNWLDTEANGRRVSPTGGRDSQTLITQTDDGATVLGTLELKGRKLVLEVNSEGRAERGHALVEGALAGLVGAPDIERHSMAELMATPSDHTNVDALPENARTEIEARFLTEHYAALLDEPIPALGDVSPREAVKTGKGREQTIEWLKDIENHLAHLALRERALPFDSAWLWEELGLSDRRS